MDFCKQVGVDRAHVVECSNVKPSLLAKRRKKAKEQARKAPTRKKDDTASLKASRTKSEPRKIKRNGAARRSAGPGTIRRGPRPERRVDVPHETCRSCGAPVDPMSGACRC